MVELASFIFGSFFGLISFKTFRVGQRIYPYLFNRSFLKIQSKRTLKIAVITGATDGLGKSFAQQLFLNNYYLILLGRSQNRLDNTLKDFQNLQLRKKILQSKVIHSSYLIDFAQLKFASSEEKIQEIVSLVQSKLVSTQINQVDKISLCFINSCGQSHIIPYEQTPLNEIDRINSTNMNSLHFISKILFQTRKQNNLRPDLKKKCQYNFINISSGVDNLPNKYSSIYSGAKSYNSNLMTAFHLKNQFDSKTQENKTYFLNLTPLYIKTKMTRYLKSWDVAQPQQIVDGAFKLLKKRSEGAGCIKHELLKQFSFLIQKQYDERVEKGLQLKRKIMQMQKRRKYKQNKK